MVEEAAVVVEAEQQRAHAPAPGLVAEPADDTVGSAQMLDLEHGAFPRQVGEVQALRHHPVDLDMAAGEPFFRFPQVAGERREQKPFAFSCFCKEGFDGGPAFLERKRQKRLPGLFQQAVEEDQTGGRLAGQALDAAGGGMKAHLQGVERQRSVDGEDELSVEHERAQRKRSKVRDHFRKEPRQRLAGLRFDLDLVSRPERKAAEPVPLRFELPAGAVRQLRGSLGLHRLERQRNAEQVQVCGALLRLGAHCSQTNRLMML